MFQTWAMERKGRGRGPGHTQPDRKLGELGLLRGPSLLCESPCHPGMEVLSVVREQSLPHPHLLLEQGMPGARSRHPG